MCILHTKTMINSNKNYRRRGVALVELSLVLSILLLLSLLIIQYGIIMNTAVSLTNLSREGARFAAIQPKEDDDIKEQIRKVLPPSIQYNQIQNSIIITPAEGHSDRLPGSQQLITVQINYNMANRLFLPAELRFPFMKPVKIFSTTYSAKTSMMVEGT